MKTTKHIDESLKDRVETRDMTEEEMALVVGGIYTYSASYSNLQVSKSPSAFRSLTIDPRLGGYVGGSLSCDCCTWEPAIG